MSTQAYPSGLPGPRTATYSNRELPTTRQFDAQIGGPVIELFRDDVPTFFNVGWLFNKTDLQAFEGWFKWRIVKGSLPFTISLNVGKGYETHTCYFTNSYRVAGAGRLFQVSAELISATRVYDDQATFEALLV